MTNFKDFIDGGDHNPARPHIWLLPEPFRAPDAYDVGLEIVRMAEHQDIYRDQVRAALGDYRRWKHDYEHETDGFEKIHRAYEGIFVRRQLADAWRSYVAINREYHGLVRFYRTSQYPFHRRVA